MASSIAPAAPTPKPSRLPEVTQADRRGWLMELDRVERATRGYLRGHPDSACPQGCSACCQHAAPLVSDVEFALVDDALRQLGSRRQEQVGERSLALRESLEGGEGDDFVCPLLVDGRCLVYSARPYLCRSFGHSSRQVDGRQRAFACQYLQGACEASPPPLLDFRITALRRVLGRVIDSYLPIWLSTKAEQRRLAWPRPDRAVMIARDEARVWAAKNQSPKRRR